MDAKENIISNLKTFINDYSQWIENTKNKIDNLEGIFQETANLHIEKCSTSLKRMSDGIAFLEDNPQALFAFRLANYAMLLQQIHGSLESRDLSTEFVNPKPEDGGNRKWRPFQLAFLLLNVRGIPVSSEYDKNEAEIIQ